MMHRFEPKLVWRSLQGALAFHGLRANSHHRMVVTSTCFGHCHAPVLLMYILIYRFWHFVILAEDD